MKISHHTRRHHLALLMGTALGLRAQFAHAQNWPAKPITMVVPFPAGGIVDNVTRAMLPGLSATLGQSMIVDNRGGAGGSIGSAVVAKAKPDGNTLLMAFDTHAVNPQLYKLPFDSEQDLTPVALVGTSPLIVVVPQASPLNSIQDLVSAAKANPGALNYASTGAGSSNQLAAELFKMTAGADLLHVPYKGGAPAISETLAGRVDVMFVSAASVLSHIQAGKLKALAVTTRERIPQLPLVPTVSESFPGYEAQSWIGMLAPRNTPADIIQRLNSEVNAAISKGPLRERLQSQAIRPTPGTPESFGRFMRAEAQRWAPVIRGANIRVD